MDVGLLPRLESDGLISSMAGSGVVGGVENVSVSGDGCSMADIDVEDSNVRGF